MERKEYTTADIIAYLQEELRMGEDLWDPDATTISGKKVDWEKDIMSPTKQAIANLENGDPSDARALLDGYIANSRRAIERSGRKPTEHDQAHTEKLEALRRSLG